MLLLLLSMINMIKLWLLCLFNKIVINMLLMVSIFSTTHCWDDINIARACLSSIICWGQLKVIVALWWNSQLTRGNFFNTFLLLHLRFESFNYHVSLHRKCCTLIGHLFCIHHHKISRWILVLPKRSFHTRLLRPTPTDHHFFSQVFFIIFDVTMIHTKASLCIILDCLRTKLWLFNVVDFAICVRYFAQKL